jgi:hypothetical protein
MNTTITYIRSCLSRIPLPTCDHFRMLLHHYIWIYKHLPPPSINLSPSTFPSVALVFPPSTSLSRVPSLNRPYSSKAKSYDEKPWQKKIAAQVASALDSHTSWLGANWVSDTNNECRLLDYACGTGSVTRVTSLPLSLQSRQSYTAR